VQSENHLILHVVFTSLGGTVFQTVSTNREKKKKKRSSDVFGLVLMPH